MALAVGTTEEAAKKRVQRALEKLRGMLVSRGNNTSAAALAATLEAARAQALPAGLSAAVVGSVALKGAAGTVALSPLTRSTLLLRGRTDAFDTQRSSRVPAGRGLARPRTSPRQTARATRMPAKMGDWESLLPALATLVVGRITHSLAMQTASSGSGMNPSHPASASHLIAYCEGGANLEEAVCGVRTIRTATCWGAGWTEPQRKGVGGVRPEFE